MAKLGQLASQLVQQRLCPDQIVQWRRHEMPGLLDLNGEPKGTGGHHLEPPQNHGIVSDEQ